MATSLKERKLWIPMCGKGNRKTLLHICPKEHEIWRKKKELFCKHEEKRYKGTNEPNIYNLNWIQIIKTQDLSTQFSYLWMISERNEESKVDLLVSWEWTLQIAFFNQIFRHYYKEQYKYSYVKCSVHIYLIYFHLLNIRAYLFHN